MNIPIFFAQSACCGQNASIFLILLLLIIVALIVWLIMWLLFGCCQKDCGSEQESEASLADSSDEPELTRESTDSEEEKADTSEEESGFESASEEEARNLFEAELEVGSVRQDPVYGIVYDGSPEGGADDLKKIKGVAAVLEGKLNDIGVYRFKQIAVWTDAACEEFSKLLTFKDRIYKDNWIAQAKDFHEEKYDEEL